MNDENDPFASDLDTFGAPQPQQFGPQQFADPNQQVQAPFIPGAPSQPQGPPGQQQQAPTEPLIPWSQVQSLIAQRTPAPQQQVAAPQPTPEQIAAHMRHFNVDDQLVNNFLSALERGEDGKRNADGVKKALEQLVLGLRAENLRGMELLSEARDATRTQALAPVSTFVQQQQAERVWGEFSGAFPGLAGFRDYVDMMADRINPASLPPGTTKQQWMGYIAQSVTQELNRMGIQIDPRVANNFGAPQGGPQQQQNNLQRPNPQVPAMQQMTYGNVPRGGQQRGQQTNPYAADSETFPGG